MQSSQPSCDKMLDISVSENRIPLLMSSFVTTVAVSSVGNGDAVDDVLLSMGSRVSLPVSNGVPKCGHELAMQ